MLAEELAVRLAELVVRTSVRDQVLEIMVRRIACELDAISPGAADRIFSPWPNMPNTYGEEINKHLDELRAAPRMLPPFDQEPA